MVENWKHCMFDHKQILGKKGEILSLAMNRLNDANMVILPLISKMVVWSNDEGIKDSDKAQ